VPPPSELLPPELPPLLLVLAAPSGEEPELLPPPELPLPEPPPSADTAPLPELLLEVMEPLLLPPLLVLAVPPLLGALPLLLPLPPLLAPSPGPPSTFTQKLLRHVRPVLHVLLGKQAPRSSPVAAPPPLPLEQPAAKPMISLSENTSARRRLLMEHPPAPTPRGGSAPAYEQDAVRFPKI
jgi:hypothetical protein